MLMIPRAANALSVFDLGSDRKSLDGHVMKAHAASGSNKTGAIDARSLFGLTKSWAM